MPVVASPQPETSFEIGIDNFVIEDEEVGELKEHEEHEEAEEHEVRSKKKRKQKEKTKKKEIVKKFFVNMFKSPKKGNVQLSSYQLMRTPRVKKFFKQWKTPDKSIKPMKNERLKLLSVAVHSLAHQRKISLSTQSLSNEFFRTLIKNFSVHAASGGQKVMTYGNARAAQRAWLENFTNKASFHDQCPRCLEYEEDEEEQEIPIRAAEKWNREDDSGRIKVKRRLQVDDGGGARDGGEEFELKDHCGGGEECQLADGGEDHFDKGEDHGDGEKAVRLENAKKAKCADCSKSFTTIKILKRHINTIHGKRTLSDEEKASFKDEKCPMCGVGITDPGRHREVCAALRLQCPTCKTWVSRSNMKRHKEKGRCYREVNKEADWQGAQAGKVRCTLCGKELKERSLKSHLLIIHRIPEMPESQRGVVDIVDVQEIIVDNSGRPVLEEGCDGVSYCYCYCYCDKYNKFGSQ